jgi:hypothetical protein
VPNGNQLAFAQARSEVADKIVTVQGELDNFGIADPTTFAAKLQKAG